ncbi:MAG: 23S rRNA (guanosine(2251)-2'-O)-methyltransferase RlmB [Candidatus Gastranaerophilales bacterium]|nr:23S rRNA (guanosine(2251)-2'-O)-methyltransferase RlmB [Candidatus Gastranaerophilales bacterium]
MQNENNDIIYGKNSVLEALIAGEREFNKILIANNIHSDTKLNQIKELAQKKGVVFQFVAKEKFSQWAGLNHQGVIAQISPIKYTDLDEFLEQKHQNASLVILDGIEDSHNLGAIIRTCVCAGVSAIIIPSRRNVQINSIVEKTSAGAINHIPIIKVNSLVSTVQRLKNSDWWVIATDASAKDNYYNINYCDMNFALIMGAEHSGVSKSLIKEADFLVKIPMLKDFNSLNVSNALSAIIFETVRQKSER